MPAGDKDKREALAKYRHLLTREKTPPEAAPTTAAVISKEPVLYAKPESEPVAPKPKDASLDFVPRNVSRPGQAKAQKPVMNKAAIAAMTAAPAQGAEKRLTYDEWKEVGVPQPGSDSQFFDNRPQRPPPGGYHNRNTNNKKKKKKANEDTVRDWNEVYDITKPLSYQEYAGSDVQFGVRRKWRKFLMSFADEDPATNEAADGAARTGPQGSAAADEASPSSFAQLSSTTMPALPRQAAPPASVPNDATGEDAYARRMAMSRGGVQPVKRSETSTPPPVRAPDPASTQTSIQPPAQVLTQSLSQTQALTPAQPTSQLPAQASRDTSPQPPTPAPNQTSTQPPAPSLTPASASKKVIFAAPVMYGTASSPDSSAQTNTEAQRTDSASEEAANATLAQPDDAEQAPRFKRASRKDWSKKLLMKSGWSEGSGLGATGQGIVEPLSLQVNKRRKIARDEEDGGGFAGSSIIGKITGGTRSKEAEAAAAEEYAKGPGELSRVIILEGLTRGMDLEKEMESGNLINKVGEECGKNGLVERIQVDWQSEDPAGAPIFVQFNNEMAAMKALQDMKGRDFNGSKIDAKFYNAAKFEAGMLS